MITLMPMNFLLPQESPLMEAAKAKAELFNKAGICLTAEEGATIAFLLELAGSQRVVEIGTLTGYSTLWLHRALPESGRIWTLEKNAEHAETAREIFLELTEGPRIELIEGDARENLGALLPEAPFDAVFVDGNKGAYWDYLQWAQSAVRKGGMLIFDNVYLGGALGNPDYRGKFSKRVINKMQDVVDRLTDRTAYKAHCFGGRDGLICAKKLF